MRWLTTLVFSIGLAASSLACYNDVDTNLIELRDNLDITNAVAGRYTVFPPEYYKRRIEIQSAILKNDPNNLDAYDNISVAYDRIGDGNSALKWIREKRKHLENAPKNQLYSTEANEGTFLIVRWIRSHKPGDVTDAIESEKHIAKALQINPDAHFGREFAQLYCIRAMIQSGKDKDWQAEFIPNLISIADKDHIDHKKLRFGIAGMMVLGAAWKLPIFIQTIASLLPDDYQMAALCQARLHDIDPNLAPLVRADVPKRDGGHSNDVISNNDLRVIEHLIQNAKDYQANNDKWVLINVANGQHPDTQSKFWEGFQEVPPVPKGDFNIPPKNQRSMGDSTAKIVNGTLIFFGLFGVFAAYLIVEAIIKGRKV